MSQKFALSKSDYTFETEIKVDLAQPIIEVYLAQPIIKVYSAQPIIKVDLEQPIIKVDLAQPIIKVYSAQPILKVDLTQPILNSIFITTNYKTPNRDFVMISFKTFKLWHETVILILKIMTDEKCITEKLPFIWYKPFDCRY